MDRPFRFGVEALKKAIFSINNFLQDSIIVVIIPEDVKKIKKLVMGQCSPFSDPFR
jgi:hypothetical protein